MVYSTPSKQPTRKKRRVTNFIEMKKSGRKIASITCYDSTFANLVEHSDIDFVLVGDSLGNVIQGKNSTVQVTIKDIAYHVQCVSSTLKTPLLVADMPFGTAGVGRKETHENAAILMRAGAEAIKIEGSSPEIIDQISFLTSHGIPVMGHIGLQPQSVHAIGGYKIQGRDALSRDRLIHEAQSLQQAGCFAIVLELVEPLLAEEISKGLEIPTIGIGSGNHCDGNILVLQDMLGMNSQFKPKFLKHYAQLQEQVIHALNEYCEDVKNKTSEGT